MFIQDVIYGYRIALRVSWDTRMDITHQVGITLTLNNLHTSVGAKLLEAYKEGSGVQEQMIQEF